MKISRKKVLENWWYYNKIYALVALFILIALIRFIWKKVTEVKADVCAAIVTSSVIPQDAVDELQSALESLCGDYNGDGKVFVKITGYGDPGADALGYEGEAYKTASEAELIGDISDCDSYLYITDDPVSLQRSWQILAEPDGSAPADTDYSAAGKTIPLSSVFSEADGVTSPFLESCSIGRRCFYNDKVCANIDGCDEIWEKIAARA